ncbi:hypothetical protein M8J76_000571 [Diaphorina citri]|nr:hypothetical protein M8J76_000571 [Diaphorina citri]
MCYFYYEYNIVSSITVAALLACHIGFGTGYSSGLFASTTQDEDDLWEEERDVEGEDRIIAKLAQIIRDMKLKYAPQSRTPPPPAPHPAFVPDFTYHFPQIDVGSIDFSAIPFAVRPNEPQYYQTDFSSNIKKQIGSLDHTSQVQSHETHHPSLKPHPYRPQENLDTTRPQFMRPMVILVKNDDEAKDDPVTSQVHKTNPKFSSVHKGKEEDGHFQESQVFITKGEGFDDDDSMYFVALVSGCSVALLLVIALGAYSWYKLQHNSKLGADVKYPAYSVGGVTKNGTPPSSGDRRLAHSAQMYHYQHQKQQILALENNSRDQRRGSVSDVESDDENEGDHTVYECPTLPLTNKKTPDIEVKKPTVEQKPTPSLPSSNTSDESKPTDPKE